MKRHREDEREKCEKRCDNARPMKKKDKEREKCNKKIHKMENMKEGEDRKREIEIY